MFSTRTRRPFAFASAGPITFPRAILSCIDFSGHNLVQPSRATNPLCPRWIDHAFFIASVFPTPCTEPVRARAHIIQYLPSRKNHGRSDCRSELLSLSFHRSGREEVRAGQVHSQQKMKRRHRLKGSICRRPRISEWKTETRAQELHLETVREIFTAYTGNIEPNCGQSNWCSRFVERHKAELDSRCLNSLDLQRHHAGSVAKPIGQGSQPT